MPGVDNQERVVGLDLLLQGYEQPEDVRLGRPLIVELVQLIDVVAQDENVADLPAIRDGVGQGNPLFVLVDGDDDQVLLASPEVRLPTAFDDPHSTGGLGAHGLRPARQGDGQHKRQGAPHRGTPAETVPDGPDRTTHVYLQV